MSIVGVIQGRMSRGLALALPVLVIVSYLYPLLYLGLGTRLTWAAAGIVILTAVGVCTFLLRDYGVRRALSLTAIGVGTAVVAFIALAWGMRTLGATEDMAVHQALLMTLFFTPFVLITLGVFAFSIQISSLPSDRFVLSVAWAIAFATPFALASPVASVSGRAGNFGWDALVLFLMPLAAFLAWTPILVAVPAPQCDTGGPSAPTADSQPEAPNKRIDTDKPAV